MALSKSARSAIYLILDVPGDTKGWRTLAPDSAPLLSNIPEELVDIKTHPTHLSVRLTRMGAAVAKYL